MLTPEKWPNPRDQEETRLVESVKRRGAHVVTTPCNLDTGAPDSAHTVGFYANFGQPEVMVMGVSAERGVLILSELYRRIYRGMKITDGQVVPGIFEGRDGLLAKVRISDALDHIDWLLWFYTPIRCEFPLLQLLWPDKEGRFPVDSGCNPVAAKLQKISRSKELNLKGKPRRNAETGGL